MKTCIVLAALLFATPVVAQKTPRIASESLHLYDAKGQAVGHYLGFGYVLVPVGTQRIEAFFPYGGLQPDQPAISFLYESGDCSGPGLNWADEGKLSLGIRNGWIFQSGALIYPDGEIKTTSFLSFKYMLGNGTFTPCEAIVHDPEYIWTLTVAPIKVITVGPGPLTVK